jgi:phosphatidylserine/phosphatidylglycerophosphate/cardiolipin synthase-like enzyme
MHNKFWIFDYRNNDDANKSFLLTGSANISHPQFHSDKNNIIIIQDESLCAVYTREFEEMWGSNTDQPDTTRAKFGAEKTDNTPHILDVAGTRMEVYFSPTDSVSAFISQLILTKPTHSLFFCMLKFELPAVEEALHSIYNNGINIKGVFDLANAFLPNSAFPRMNGNAVPNSWNPAADVFLDSISGLIHHKYLIIDPDIPEGNKIISTGSFNWEVPADIGNDENSLTIFDARVNNLYFQEFHQRYKESGGELILIHYASELLSSDLSQFQIYPNPFYSTTNINFEIVNSSFVKIIVYDILGREVQTLINKEISPGTYEAQFDGSSLNNGIYFCKIFAGDYSETERIMLLK